MYKRLSILMLCFTILYSIIPIPIEAFSFDKPERSFLWGSFNYEYVLARKQVIMGFETSTNSLPLGLSMYMWVDYMGAIVDEDISGKDAPGIHDFQDYAGSINLYWPIGRVVGSVLTPFDLEIEYNYATFYESNLYFGPHLRILDIPFTSGVRKKLDSLSYPGGSTLDASLYFHRSDGNHGVDKQWMKLALLYIFPFHIGEVKLFSKAWADIDFNDPLGTFDLYGKTTKMIQNTLGVNLWSDLWLCWEYKYEDFHYWTKFVGNWTPLPGKDVRSDNSIMLQWWISKN